MTSDWGARDVSQWQGACWTCPRTWIQTPALKNKQKHGLLLVLKNMINQTKLDYFLNALAYFLFLFLLRTV